MVRCYWNWKLVVNIPSGRLIRWSYKDPFFHAYRTLDWCQSLCPRDPSTETRNWCGLRCIGAIGRSWFGETMDFKGRGKKLQFSTGTNGHKKTNWHQYRACLGMLIYLYQFLTVLVVDCRSITIIIVKKSLLKSSCRLRGARTWRIIAAGEDTNRAVLVLVRVARHAQRMRERSFTRERLVVFDLVYGMRRFGRQLQDFIVTTVVRHDSAHRATATSPCNSYWPDSLHNQPCLS